MVLMCTIFELLQKVNDVTPFRWELLTDGVKYTILCEGIEVHDAKSGVMLTDMSPKKCEAWLRILLVRAKRIEIGE